MHKANGGTFQTYQHKIYQPISVTEIQKHLDGIQQIGVYPLLQDNTSWFLVAEFDKENWQKDAIKFLNRVKKGEFLLTLSVHVQEIAVTFGYFLIRHILMLKPYFVKELKSKSIEVELFVEFEYGKLVSQLATSQDIERINKEIIEGVKFQFLMRVISLLALQPR